MLSSSSLSVFSRAMRTSNTATLFASATLATHVKFQRSTSTTATTAPAALPPPLQNIRILDIGSGSGPLSDPDLALELLSPAHSPSEVLVPGPVDSIIVEIVDFIPHAAGGRRFDLYPESATKGVTRGEVIRAISEIYKNEYELARRWKEASNPNEVAKKLSGGAKKQENDVTIRALAALHLDPEAEYDEQTKVLRPRVRTCDARG